MLITERLRVGKSLGLKVKESNKSLRIITARSDFTKTRVVIADDDFAGDKKQNKTENPSSNKEIKEIKRRKLQREGIW